tara:strand:+ start:81638 stop:82471 length:834 start_codon:yes stop_codon:yes gene_type:complete
MTRILLPTDFSENAQNAINYATRLFKDEACHFYLLNTYTPLIYSYDYQMSAGGYLGDVIDVVRKNSITKLEEINKKMTAPNHQVHIISSFGVLTDEVDRIIDEHAIDLVIMGTKGATGVKELLFGSNTMHVIKKAKCPVMAIPDGYFFEAPKDLLFPTDYLIDYTEKHLQILKKIAAIYKSKINVLNVSYGSEHTQAEIKNKSTLEKLLIDFNDKYHSLKDQEIDEAINEFQKTTYIQLLVMINNKHSFFENILFKPVIKQLGFHLKTPFLIIPSKA